MNVLKILIVMLILIMSVGAVCAAENITDDAMGDDNKDISETVQEDIATDDSADILKTTSNDVYTTNDDSFTNLTYEIENNDVVDLTHDYIFNINTDDSSGIVINKDNFVLNGNGRTIDGNNQSRLFSITGDNITLNDLILINGNYGICAGIRAVGTITLNNVTFINNYASQQGGAIGIRDGTILICNNCRFIDNYAESGSAILGADSEIRLYDTYITSKNFSKASQIFLSPSTEIAPTEIYMKNTTFANITASYAPALYLKGSKASIIDSKFINLKANITAGAISTKSGAELYIENCEFENVTSSKNGGAIYADIPGDDEYTGTTTILDSKFMDTYSEFGGAIVQLGGNFVLKNTEFINSDAEYNGGAIYISHANAEINNCTFESDDTGIIEGYPTYGGAIFSDKSTLTVTESKFFNNRANAGSAIYAYDTSYDITNSVFENNTNPIYTVFDNESVLENNVYINDDNVSTNNTYYATIIIGEGMQLVLLNNTLSVNTLPSRFDLRDWGWVSSVKNQAWMGACWTFGMTGTLESALLKAAGITTDFSENNMQNTMLKYSIYGGPIVEGGANVLSTSYLLSWLGAFTQDADTYDEMGKLSPVITTQNDIHIQDVMFTPNTEIPEATSLKLAIMKYGSIDAAFFGQSTYDEVNPYYNPETCAQYVDKPLTPSHDISIIGWDDNYDAGNFLITPPGNGAWIVKNSYGTEWGDNGFFYLSYYDKTLLNSKDVTTYATSIIIENTEPYNKNYQHALIWGGEFKSGNQNVSYMNVFEALDDDLIAGVGTYFDKEGIDYTIEIFVNDELKLTQTGVSPYFGYRTIKLNKYIPVKEGDVFKAVITSNAAPTVNLTTVRPHYTQDLSFISFDGETMKDTYDLGYITCLKVYTVADPDKTYTFTELERLISESGQYLSLDGDYSFYNETDDSSGIHITKDNFVLNGNGHTVDGKNLSRLFYITGGNITLNDLILINGNYQNCAGICAVGTTLTLNNVTLINNYGEKQGGAIGLDSTTLICNNTRFIDNYAEDGPSILVMDSEVKLYNSYITSKYFVKGSQIYLTPGTEAYIENTTFANTTSSYAPAINLRSSKASIINSKFLDLKAIISAGAIVTKAGGELYIENCEFENVTSSKNGGAIFADVAGGNDVTGNVTIISTTFRDTYSEFGGAYVQLGGDFVLKNSEFINSNAKYDGGAIYLSYINAEIDNCTFDSDESSIIEGYPTYGGAIYCDMSTLTVTESKFFNNVASAGSAIYAYDTSYSIKNSLFENNANPIYTVFDKESVLENNVYTNDDNVSTNNTYYATIMIGEGMQLVLLNNTINVETLPSRFDLRDWGWVSSVKNQGGMGACWTFGMTGTLESALLKAAGITTDFSENNMQNTMLKYSIYGSTMIVEGGANTLSTGYLLSWLGAFTQDADTYDEVGKISPVITTQNDIHIQDVMFTPNNEIPNGTQLKLAIMKYGSIDVSFYGQATSEEVNPYYNPKTHAHYVDEDIEPSHAVSIIGWDDNYDASNFLITPPGNGAWIAKNSYGTGWGDNGFFYISYYDKTLLNSKEVIFYATSIIIENTEPYNKNYQYNLIWEGDFKSGNQNVSYMSEFKALDDDLIAGVGTFFDKEGNDYTVEIYVNDELKLTQTGVSPYFGYHTIKLNKYIPIKEGDVFKAVITSKSAPTLNLTGTRSHYTQNLSFISFDGEPMKDSYDLGYIVCLKVYTVADSSKANTFTELERLINASGQCLTLDGNYAFYNETDNPIGILITRDNFVLNGNGYTVDGKNLSRIFNITANNVTINDLVLINGNAEKGGAIYTSESLTLNNATFINNYAGKNGGAVALYEDVTLNCSNSQFIDNYAVEGGSSIVVAKGELNLYNTDVTSKIYSKGGQIMGSIGARFYLENITFANTTATYAPAIYLVGSRIRIVDSRFINLKANMTAGAMSLREGGELYIKNCEFINTTSSRNAGAIYVDIIGYNPGNEGNVTIIDSKFKDTSSAFAGAYLQLGGQFWLSNTEFTNSHATYNGGAVYLSFTETEISNCTFESNGVDVIEGYPTYGGAIFCDISTLNITDSKFFNNVAGEGNAIYAYDSSFNIKGSTFKNNTNAVYSVFTKDWNIDASTVLNNDTVSTNNTFYATIMVGEGIQLNLTNNTFNVNVIPAKFDLRDWGWVSPVRDQGWMGACWTFGMTGALESALMKATGIPFTVSMNNMKTVMRYSPYGALEVFEGGANLASVSYLLSWLGAIPYDVDTYDELGKITMPISTGQNIHVQDIIFIPNNEIPNGTQIKLAIMKYGSLDVSFFGQSSYDDEAPYYNPKTYAQFVDLPETANHEVSIIGWDDNFPKEKFLMTPPGNGAWIIKNSYGTEWGDNGFLYVSYYDKSLLAYKPGKVTDYAAATIIENTVPYNKNYQYDITWLSNYEPSDGNISYMNVFEALDDDLIAGVGTYFNESGVSYTVNIYVNDELKLTQEGVSPYVGYHTIKLDSYIPIKKGDVFKAAITSNWVPYVLLEDVRVHYTQNLSFVSFDGETWQDAYDLGYIACLKVYTVADDSEIIGNENITVDYGSESSFSVKVVTADGHEVAGAEVEFTINNKTTKVLTDEDGVAEIKIAEVAGTYTLTTTYNNKTYSNTVDINKAESVLTGQNLEMYVGDGSKFNVTLKDSEGNPISGMGIKISIVGKTYTVITDSKGVASLPIGLKAGSYPVSAVFNGNTLYNSSNVVTNSVDVYTKVRIVENSDLVKDYTDDSKAFKVRALDKYGKPVGAYAKVKMTIAGKTYTVNTDSNGYASLPINLRPGEYDIVCEYAGTKVTNKITVKNVIYATNRQWKIGSSFNKFTATLKNSDGKFITGKQVSFTVNSKTLTAVTDAKGEATVTITDLAAGKYDITVQYINSKIKRTINIVN